MERRENNLRRKMRAFRGNSWDQTEKFAANMKAISKAVGPLNYSNTYAAPVSKPSNMPDYIWDDVRPFDPDKISDQINVHTYQPNIAESGRYRGIDRIPYKDTQNKIIKG